ncbi:MAG: DUF2206 domain-containing protein [Halobacteriota archaeon]
MVELKNLDAKKYFAILIAILFLTDLIILLNIPFLRQILGFLCFTTIPGILILHILKQNKIEFLKKFVLSVGLSVAFLMFAGLLVNSFYPVILKPLSLEPILISFNIILIILAFIAYKRNKDDFDIKDVFNFKLDLKDKLASPLIFPILFPFIAVFGTYLMNTQGNNVILLAMLFLIPAYVVAVVCLRDRISDATYPVAVLMIGMSLLLMHGLTCNYITGADIHGEYYVFQLAASNFHWDISNYPTTYNACLSITILPTICQVLLNMEGNYVYKFMYQLVFSITPLGLYILFKKYIDEIYAFLAAVFFISQTTFVFEMISAERQEIAILFFILAMMVFFDTEIDKLNKRIMFLVFVFGVIVSHYTTAYVFFFIVFLSWLMMAIPKTLKSKKNITATILLLFSVVIFFWYSQVTQVPFSAGVNFVEQTFRNLGNFFVEEARAPSAMNVVGIGLEEGIPYKIQFWVRNITFFFIALGALDLLRKYKTSKFGTEYLAMMVVCAGIVWSMLILPFIASGYGITRLYLQALVLLAPCFVIGGEVFTRSILKIKSIKTPKIQMRSVLSVVLIVLVLQNMCATTVMFNVFGVPLSEDLNAKGNLRESLYIYEGEVVGAEWLANHNLDNSIVHCDRPGYQRIYLGYESAGRYKLPRIDTFFFINNKTQSHGYIYLRHTNIVDGKVHPVSIYPTSSQVNSTAEYSHLFIGKNKIYNNAGSEIWK